MTDFLAGRGGRARAAAGAGSSSSGHAPPQPCQRGATTRQNAQRAGLIEPTIAQPSCAIGGPHGYLA
jgi:hypothetical protein